MSKELIPSEVITEFGSKHELEWLRSNENGKFEVKPSAFMRLESEVNYMKKFIDEIYKSINTKKKK